MSSKPREIPRAEVGVPTILETSGRQDLVCQCKSVIAAGNPLFLVEGVPSDVREIFEGRAFCSVRCIHAFCLDSLATLETLDTTGSKAIVTDLHDLYEGLAAAFSQILRLH